MLCALYMSILCLLSIFAYRTNMSIIFSLLPECLQYSEFIEACCQPAVGEPRTFNVVMDCIVKKVLTKKDAKVTKGDHLFILGFKVIS